MKQVLSLAAGREHTCALLSDRTVKCWGDNDHGQLGDGTQTAKAVPTVVPKLANVISLAAGSSNTCAVLSDGTVWCWGENDSGQAGSTGPNRLVPAQVEGVTRAVTVRTHSNNTCATLSDGELLCWGSNVHQQLGKKAGTRSAAPVRIATKGKVSVVSVGYDFLCSLDGQGAVACWGWNQGSRTGRSDQDLMFDVTEAKPLASKLPFTRLASGSGHACVLRNDGAVWCWGKNAFGAAGASESGAPSPISGLEQASEIAAGTDHSCALHADGSVHCWGANLSGQLGTTASVKSLVPVRAL